jgi:hypothetical protein
MFRCNPWKYQVLRQAFPPESEALTPESRISAVMARIVLFRPCNPDNAIQICWLNSSSQERAIF